MARDVQILGALLKLQNENVIGSTVDQIREKVNIKSEKKFTKAWIYKCLSNLEEEGFITVNRIDTPNTYTAGLGPIGKALTKHINRRRIQLDEERQELTENIQFLRNQSSDILAERVIESLTGVQAETTTRVVEGLQNVRSVIITELAENVGEGDILRATERGNILDLEGTEAGAVETRIFRAMENGLEVRVIFRDNPFPQGVGSEPLTEYLLKEKKSLIKLIIDGKMKVRIAGKATPSYRMLSLNREKMLLFLADSPRPDSVALITYEANPKLLDDAIDAFDRAWEQAEDITEGIIPKFQ
jgi:DNA-binding PadR family transcriptional regulator